MNYTDCFIYVLIYSNYVGRSIVNGFTFGQFDATNMPRTTLNLAESMDRLFAQFSISGFNTSIMDSYLALAGANQLTVNGVHMYGKFDSGQTIIAKKAVSYQGTRNVGTTQILPGFITGSIKASSQVFGERGTSYGLPGVLPGDVSGDFLSTSQTFYTEANKIVNILNAGQLLEANGSDYLWNSATVKRIPYVTANNKPASRMPYEPGDIPSVYRLGSFGVNTKVSYNQRRKAGNGQ